MLLCMFMILAKPDFEGYLIQKDRAQIPDITSSCVLCGKKTFSSDFCYMSLLSMQDFSNHKWSRCFSNFQLRSVFISYQELALNGHSQILFSVYVMVVSEHLRSLTCQFTIGFRPQTFIRPTCLEFCPFKKKTIMEWLRRLRDSYTR